MNLFTLKITAAVIWAKAWPILVAIAFFGLIIAIHELGHFTAARIFKVRINEFAIGMGPAIFKKKGKETQYSLRVFPIGGYVAMEGEDGESEDARAFCNQKSWKKLIIVAAGATMNLILGLIFCLILVLMTDLIGTTQIHSFHENATSAKYGLQAGDQITAITGTRIFADRDISYCLIRDDDGIYDIQVKRDGKTVLLEDVHFQTEPAENGRNRIIFDFILVGKEKSFFNVIPAAFKDALSTARFVWLTLFDLITGHYGINDLSGPVGTINVIAQAASDSATPSIAFENLIYIMALITINIGIFNLLPIPALDGGRIFFILIEIIFRKKIPSKYESLIHAIGLGLLLLLMVFITFNDIKNLITAAVGIGGFYV